MTALQIFSVTSAARAVEILMSGSAEAVDDVVGARPHGSRSGSREAEDPKRLPDSRCSKNLNARARAGVFRRAGLRFAREDGHIDTAPVEFMGDLPRYIFDAAGGGREAFDDEGDAQDEILNRSADHSRLGIASDPRVRKIRHATKIVCDRAQRPGGREAMAADSFVAC